MREPASAGSLPALVGLDRTDRAGAHRRAAPALASAAVARDLGIAQLAEDLHDAGGILAEQHLGLSSTSAISSVRNRRARMARHRAIGLASAMRKPSPASRLRSALSARDARFAAIRTSASS